LEIGERDEETSFTWGNLHTSLEAHSITEIDTLFQYPVMALVGAKQIGPFEVFVAHQRIKLGGMFWKVLPQQTTRCKAAFFATDVIR